MWSFDKMVVGERKLKKISKAKRREKNINEKKENA